jgi:Fe-S cluster biogenesis protein NfuA/nitrite reductase/ring-hydroxylating ferredoxin subunit
MNTENSPTTAGTPTVTVDDLEQLAERVDKAIAEVQSLEPADRARAMNLKSTIEEFHKAGLTHIVKTLKDDSRGKELLFQLVEEPTVYALFAMHGLIRADLKTRVSRVIDMVRPYMQSHGGDVRLVDVRDRTALVRLSGNCNGCSMSSVTLRNTVEESLRENVPEIEAVEVVEDEVPASGLVQLQTATPPTPVDTPDDHGWVPGPLVSELGTDRPLAFESGDDRILLIRSPGGLRAWRNACAHQGLPLDGGIVDVENGTITCPWHGFQFDSDSGECFSAPQCQLEPFPLRVRDNRIWVRPE